MNDWENKLACMVLKVPIKPQTVNSCWKGRRYKTDKYKVWREEMGWLLRWKAKPILWCSIVLEFHIKHFVTTDVDNMIKPTLDALQENRVLKDDKYVLSIKATKHKSLEEKIIITIYEESHPDLH